MASIIKSEAAKLGNDLVSTQWKIIFVCVPAKKTILSVSSESCLSTWGITVIIMLLGLYRRKRACIATHLWKFMRSVLLAAKCGQISET